MIASMELFAMLFIPTSPSYQRPSQSRPVRAAAARATRLPVPKHLNKNWLGFVPEADVKNIVDQVGGVTEAVGPGAIDAVSAPAKPSTAHVSGRIEGSS